MPTWSFGLVLKHDRTYNEKTVSKIFDSLERKKHINIQNFINRFQTKFWGGLKSNPNRDGFSLNQISNWYFLCQLKYDKNVKNRHVKSSVMEVRTWDGDVH